MVAMTETLLFDKHLNYKVQFFELLQRLARIWELDWRISICSQADNIAGKTTFLGK